MALMLMPDAYRALIRPLLFRLPPETAQRVADAALKLTPVWRALGPLLEYAHPSLTTTLAGLELRNPGGLAAGYDKNCEFLPSLAALGFGYVTGGTVTPAARQGNPRPRIVRYREQESLVNALGFPGQGLDRAVARLQAVGGSSSAPVVASVSLPENHVRLGLHEIRRIRDADDRAFEHRLMGDERAFDLDG